MFISPKLIISVLLFAVAVYLFSQIKSCGYFIPASNANHIIDVHLAPEKGDSSFKIYSERFFDHAYVKDAAKNYVPSKYMGSFFPLDLVFPFIYGTLFLALAAYWKGTNFYKIFKPAVLVCVVSDLSENVSFAYYLFHRESNMNVVVAVFTTLKSVLFISCILTSVIAFVAACFSRFGK